MAWCLINENQLKDYTVNELGKNKHIIQTVLPFIPTTGATFANPWGGRVPLELFTTLKMPLSLGTVCSRSSPHTCWETTKLIPHTLAS